MAFSGTRPSSSHPTSSGKTRPFPFSGMALSGKSSPASKEPSPTDRLFRHGDVCDGGEWREEQFLFGNWYTQERTEDGKWGKGRVRRKSLPTAQDKIVPVEIAMEFRIPVRHKANALPFSARLRKGSTRALITRFDSSSVFPSKEYPSRQAASSSLW
jgi:hypothetical protein